MSPLLLNAPWRGLWVPCEPVLSEIRKAPVSCTFLGKKIRHVQQNLPDLWPALVLVLLGSEVNEVTAPVGFEQVILCPAQNTLHPPQARLWESMLHLPLCYVRWLRWWNRTPHGSGSISAALDRSLCLWWFLLLRRYGRGWSTTPLLACYYSHVRNTFKRMPLSLHAFGTCGWWSTGKIKAEKKV